MWNKVVVVALIIVVLLSCFGCTTSRISKNYANSGNMIYLDENFVVVKFHNDERNATVYIMDGFYSGGIFVLPDEK